MGEVERFIEDFERENIIFDDSIKNIERLQKDIINIKEQKVIIKNNITQKKKSVKTVNIIFLCMILIAILLCFFETEQKSIYVFIQYALGGIGIYLIVYLPLVLLSYFSHDFYEIEYAQNDRLVVRKKKKNIAIDKAKIKRVYLMANVSVHLIKNELYKKLEAREDVTLAGGDDVAIYGHPSVILYMYIEYYAKRKIKRLRFNVNNVVVSELKEFIKIFEIC